MTTLKDIVYVVHLAVNQALQSQFPHLAYYLAEFKDYAAFLESAPALTDEKYGPRPECDEKGYYRFMTSKANEIPEVHLAILRDPDGQVSLFLADNRVNDPQTLQERRTLTSFASPRFEGRLFFTDDDDVVSFTLTLASKIANQALTYYNAVQAIHYVEEPSFESVQRQFQNIPPASKLG